MLISTALAATEGAAAHGPFYAQAEFWVAIAFLIVVGGAFRPVARAMAAALDMRAEKIKARIEEAHRLREDAQEMLVTYQRKQRDAMKEAEEIIAHAKAESQRMAEQAAKELEESLKRREQQAMDRIAQAEAQALKEVREQAVDVAIAATRKLVADGMTAKQSSGMIDDAIGELAKKLH
jgi:F-type H+-transporting ATPase subunit b